MKGEQSGHVLALVRLETDCDRDSLLVQARPHGPTCHLQRASCFLDAPADFLAVLERRIEARLAADPAGSYTRRLLDKGLPKVAQKVGEEAVETVIAALEASTWSDHFMPYGATKFVNGQNQGGRAVLLQASLVIAELVKAGAQIIYFRQGA